LTAAGRAQLAQADVGEYLLAIGSGRNEGQLIVSVMCRNCTDSQLALDITSASLSVAPQSVTARGPRPYSRWNPRWSPEARRAARTHPPGGAKRPRVGVRG
jgi:hypothetical protein